MTMKKKMLTTLSVVLILGLAAMGILAYLTDRDSAANVFTVGDVSIELTEEFDEENAVLIPGVNIEKDVKIKNVGKNDAWVWATIAIPSVLDNDDASKNVIHFNYSKDSVADGQWTWMDKKGEEWAVEKDVEIKDDDILYNVYTVKYQTALEPGKTTDTSAMYKVYLDKHVDIDPEGNWYKVNNGEVTPIDWNSKDDPTIYVSAYAIQKDDFKNVHEAYDAFQVQWGLKDSENGGGSSDSGKDETAPTISIEDERYFQQKITIGNITDSDYPLTVEVYGSIDENIECSEETLKNTITVTKDGNLVQSSNDANNEVYDKSIDGNKVILYNNCAQGYGSYMIVKVKDASGNSSTTDKIFVSAAVGCFVAGTKIQTVDGLVNIEDIQVGDKVYSINLLTGKKVVNTVSWVQERRYNDETYTIYTGKEKIVTTYEHPFYVDGKGWTAAEKLKVGNKLRLMDGTNIEIDKIVRTELDKPVQVYNFTVEGTHNYLITETGILVHNVQK